MGVLLAGSSDWSRPANDTGIVEPAGDSVSLLVAMDDTDEGGDEDVDAVAVADPATGIDGEVFVG